jgi:hypothetical protein
MSCFTFSYTALPNSLRYSFVVLKQSDLFHCTCWYQDVSFNVTEVTIVSCEHCYAAALH